MDHQGLVALADRVEEFLGRFTPEEFLAECETRGIKGKQDDCRVCALALLILDEFRCGTSVLVGVHPRKVSGEFVVWLKDGSAPCEIRNLTRDAVQFANNFDEGVYTSIIAGETS